MREFYPSPLLRRKYALWVWIPWLCLLPGALLGLLPEFGWLYAAIYVGANLLWAIPLQLVVGPYCRSIRYVLTEDEVVVHKGIITKTVKTVPYSKVTNVALKRGPLDRYLGLGTLEVQTAGYSQQTGAEAPLPGLDDWETVSQHIMERVRRHRGSDGSQAPAAAAGEGETAALLAEMLAELRAVRAAIQARRG